MIITINLRDSKAKDWTRFWFATADDVPVKRFGFRMVISSPKEDYDRMKQRCIEQMRWAKQIIRAEEDDCRRISYQMVRDCKSSKAVQMARKINKQQEQIAKEIVQALYL